jgi:zinc transport system ATP-binding protein
MQIEQTENIIEVEDVSFVYGKNEVLRHISLTVPRGDYLGIVGPNGAGKTTLLKIIIGLLLPSSGRARIFGKEVSEFRAWEKIGYVPQKVTNFDVNFPATVGEVVLMGRYARRGLLKGVTAEDKAIVRRVLTEVGMESHIHRLIGDLSGGEQQRVFIARALATEPEIIFLDEPTIGVDPRAASEFYALLKRLNTDRGLTLVLVSHDIEMVVKEAKHVACIDRKLVCHTPAEDFLKENRLNSLFEGDFKIITHQHPH